MKIKINDNYRLTTDAYNFILERKGIHGEKSKTPGDDKWKQIGLYPTIDSFLRGLLKHDVIAEDINTMNELVMSVQDVHDDIKAIGEALKGLKPKGD